MLQHTHAAAPLFIDELIRIESTRDYFEQHTVFDHEASFEEIFGSYDEHEAINKSLQGQTTIEQDIERFMPIVRNNETSPLERFFIMDPVNEPSYIYGKQQLSMQGLQLGTESSATMRVLASVDVATQSNRHRR